MFQVNLDALGCDVKVVYVEESDELTRKKLQI